MDDIYLDLSEKPVYRDSDYRNLKYERHPKRIFGMNVLLLVLKGELTFTEEGQEIRVPEGEYFIQRAWRIHDSFAPCTAEFYFIHFYGSFSSNKLNNLPLKGRFDVNEMRPLLEMMTKLFFENRSNVYVAGHFYYILYKLYEFYYKESYQPTLAEKISVYITKHYADRIQLEDLQRKFGYTKEYIIREFKALYKITPHKYMTQVRITQAKLMLISTDKTISQISKDCGYDEFSTFYRAFLAETGKKPLEWKNSIVITPE